MAKSDMDLALPGAERQVHISDLERAVDYINVHTKMAHRERFRLVTDSNPPAYELEFRNLSGVWTRVLYSTTKRDLYQQLKAFSKGLEWRKP